LSPGPVAGVVLEGAAFLRAGEAIDEPGQVGVGVVGQGVVEPRVAAVLIEDAARQAAGVLRDAALEAVAVARRTTQIVFAMKRQFRCLIEVIYDWKDGI
jgi:hypothetical protein